jgi:hypothetical protein
MVVIDAVDVGTWGLLGIGMSGHEGRMQNDWSRYHGMRVRDTGIGICPSCNMSRLMSE